MGNEFSLCNTQVGMESGILKKKWVGDKGLDAKENRQTTTNNNSYSEGSSVVGGVTPGDPAVGKEVCFLVQGYL